MVNRRAAAKRAPPPPPKARSTRQQQSSRSSSSMSSSASSSSEIANHEEGSSCVGCGSERNLMDLHRETRADLLFAVKTCDSYKACLDCAFHTSLVSQARSAVADKRSRNIHECFVCRAMGRLIQLNKIEGAEAALSDPILQAPHIAGMINKSRKLCTPCAYSLNYLYKQVAKNNENTAPKPASTKPASRPRGRPKRAKSSSPEPEPVVQAGTRASGRKRPAAVKESEPPIKQLKITIPKIVTVKRDAPVVGKRVRAPPERLQLVRVEQPVKTERPAKKMKEAPKKSVRVAVKKAPAAKSAPRRAVARRTQKRVPSVELEEHECSACSEVSFGGVAAALHELSHDRRQLVAVKVERCPAAEEAVHNLPSEPASPASSPARDSSPAPSSSSARSPKRALSISSPSEDGEEEGGERKRKPRKSTSPKKNAAQDRLNDDGERSFLFVAPPIVASCPPSALSTMIEDDLEDFTFEEPIPVAKDRPDLATLQNGEDQEMHSEKNADSSDGNQIDDIIKSLEDAPAEEQVNGQATTANDAVTEPKSVEGASADDTAASVNDSSMEEGSDSAARAEETKNSQETPATNSSDLTKSNALKFDYEESRSKAIKQPGDINSVLSFDYPSPPSPEATDTDKDISAPTESSTEEAMDEESVQMNGGTDSEMDKDGMEDSVATKALKEDSLNPTLTQTVPGAAELESNLAAANTSSPDVLENLMAEVVGE